MRKSLSDEELQARVDYATSTKIGIEPMMDLVVAQEALRAQEDLEIKNWIEQMEVEGSPESLKALEDFQKQQLGTSVIADVDPTHEPEIFGQQIEGDLEDTSIKNEPEIVELKPAFSWFTQPEPGVEELSPAQSDEESDINHFTEDLSSEEILIEEVVVIEEPLQSEVVLEEVVPDGQEEPDSWSIPAPVITPVGNESQDEFELLLASAAAEEELTVLEEKEHLVHIDEKVQAATVANTLIPSDENRNRKPLSQLLAWLGVSATIIPIMLTWILITLGLSASAITIDLVIGYFLAGTLIATASLAGKRSGLSTAIVSRAVFGVWGNAIPGSIAFIVRIALAALLVAFTALLVNGAGAGLPDLSANVTSLGSFDLTIGLLFSSGLVLLVGVISIVRGTASRITQLVLSVTAVLSSFTAVVSLFTKKIGFAAPGVIGFSSKQSLLGIAIVVMVVTVLWAAVAPNLAKSIPMRERGIRVFGWVALANIVAPILASIMALTWLGPRAKELSVIMPIDLQALIVIVSELPQYSRIGLLVALSVTLCYSLLLTLKTASLDLIALLSIKRIGAALVAVILTVAALALFAAQPKALEFSYLLNVFLLVSALSAGWIGMVIADVALRRIAYHELSLSRSYGFYKRFSIVSILAWVVTLVAALALTPIDLLGFSFTGFADSAIGLVRQSSSAPIGFVISLVLGVLLTLVMRIPEIRKQEREVLLVESRREQLNNIFLGQE